MLVPLVSVAVVLLALVALGLCVLTLWRHVRMLGRDLAVAGEALARAAPARETPGALTAEREADPEPQRQARGHNPDE